MVGWALRSQPQRTEVSQSLVRKLRNVHAWVLCLLHLYQTLEHMIGMSLAYKYIKTNI
jgi:hypothetical protein